MGCALRSSRIHVPNQLALLPVLAVVLALLSACGADRDDEPLTFWAVQMGSTIEATEEALAPALADFNDDTGIDVELEVISWADLYTRITTALVGGNGPDVVATGTSWSAGLAETGAFRSFDDDAMTAIGGAERFLPTTLAAAGVPGEAPITVPWLAQAVGLFYNTAAFADAGITQAPDTWAEFVDAARRLTGDGRWGVTLPGASALTNAHYAFLLGRHHGTRLVDDAGRARFDTPELRTAVRQLIDLMTAGVVDSSDAETLSASDSAAALADGRAAMFVHQSAMRGYFTSVDFDDYAVARLPVLSPLPEEGAPVRSFVGGTNLAVLADSDQRDEAVDLVGHLVSDEQQIALNDAFGTLPVVSAAYDDPAFADPDTQLFGDVLAEEAEPLPAVPQEAQLEQVLGGAIAELWAQAATGEVTDADIAAALADAESRMPAPA